MLDEHADRAMYIGLTAHHDTFIGHHAVYYTGVQQAIFHLRPAFYGNAAQGFTICNLMHGRVQSRHSL